MVSQLRKVHQETFSEGEANAMATRNAVRLATIEVAGHSE
jgi:hypothetical protein